MACAHLWGNSIGCTVGTSAFSGLVSGTSSGLCTSSLTYFITKKRYKKWCQDNAGKYVRNKISGRLTRVPAAFIMPVALINLPVFIPLFNSLDLEGVVSPPNLTASSILQEVRSGQIEHVHSIIEEFGEVMSFEALKSSSIIGKPIKDIKLPKDVSLGAIVSI